MVPEQNKSEKEAADKIDEFVKRIREAAGANLESIILFGSAVSGGSAGGTLAGAAIGAGTGALIGSAATPQPTYYGAPPRRCAQWAYDYNGNRVCTAFY